MCISTFFYACSVTNSSAKKGRDFEKFPEVSARTETKLLDVGFPMPQVMTIYKDSLLLVVNNLDDNPHHIRVFDINKKKAIDNILPASGKKGGALSFMTVRITDSLVWVFDVFKNGFIVANLNTVLKGNGALEFYSEYRLKPQVFYYDAMLLNRNEALLSGNYDTDEKLVYVNFLDSARNKELLSYQKDADIGSSRTSKMSYESFMMLKPDKNKLVLAARYADQFELLALENGKYKKIRGPVGILPDLDPFEDNSGVTVATPGQQTLYGFLKGHATEKYFYLLFSGHPVKSHHRFFGNKIFVYDWEGNPVKQINLKNEIVDFAVTSDDQVLYSLNAQTKTISVAELTW
ncbi:MAG: BF3164 family lipoprotein [Chitinophagaceae bacterium]